VAKAYWPRRADPRLVHRRLRYAGPQRGV